MSTKPDPSASGGPPNVRQNEAIAHLARELVRAQRIVVITGAGISAESGIPTFRDAQTGLWARYDPMELAHIDAFHRDPELVTRWYHARFERCRHCEPNPGHAALARLQALTEARGAAWTLLTQNIDRLHQRAGSRNVVELHGNILTWRCTKTGQQMEMDQIDFSRFPPVSPAGALLRPNVVWFGEMLPEEALEIAHRESRLCDLFLSIGTSAVVYPAAGFATLASSRGALVAEINKDPTPLTAAVDLSIQGAAGQVLPRVAALVGDGC